MYEIADLMITVLVLFVAGVGVYLQVIGDVGKYPATPLLSLLSSLYTIALYYSPFYGDQYYLMNMVKAPVLLPLIIYLAEKDPLPDWRYRAFCLLLIGQVLMVGGQILTGFNLLFYNQISLLLSLIELFILFSGWERMIKDGNTTNNSSNYYHDNWLKSHQDK